MTGWSVEIGGPQKYKYVSSHQLPSGRKTLGSGFVDNSEWYELGCRGCVTFSSPTSALACHTTLRHRSTHARLAAVGGRLLMSCSEALRRTSSVFSRKCKCRPHKLR